MIKAFLFDYGGVVSLGGGKGNELSERLGNHLGIPSDKAWQLLVPNFNQFLKGQVTETQFWSQVETRYGTSISIAQRNVWNDWGVMRPLPVMTQLITELRNAQYQVGLLSNVLVKTALEIRQNGGYDMFDFAILSCEVGYIKPEVEIYHLAMEKYGAISPNEVVFLDDQKRCLVPAKQMGLQTIYVDDPNHAVDAVRKIMQHTSL